MSYVVVKDGIEELKEMAIESLNKLGTIMLENLTPETMIYKRYAEMWLKMYERYNEDKTERDGMFFNAPAIIVVVSDSQVNASLASSNMELMTNALGLGTFTAEKVGEVTGAGTACGRCKALINNVIELER